MMVKMSEDSGYIDVRVNREIWIQHEIWEP